MYTYAFPAYSAESTEKPRFAGGFGAIEPTRESLTTWRNRATYAKTDIAAAKRAIQAVPSALQALPLLDAALVRATEAATILSSVSEAAGTWTRAREVIVDEKLADARASYDSARGLAMSLGAYHVPKMSTWTMSAPPGTKSMGTVAPPAGPGDAPAREVPPNVIMMGMDPTLLLYGGLALGGLIVLTSFLRR